MIFDESNKPVTKEELKNLSKDELKKLQEEGSVSTASGTFQTLKELNE